MPGTKKEFTINRRGEWERTVVEADGRTHTAPVQTVNGGYVQGANGHFRREGPYREAIKAAVEANTRR